MVSSIHICLQGEADKSNQWVIDGSENCLMLSCCLLDLDDMSANMIIIIIKDQARLA